ncbi:hypothetical protein DPMN_106608 [Dreissena polymorpha]|uniref:Uncharacterized protein n=1 Tax=Dreissena polymorpha TaxID=45954 RepID=A0A9D4K597_DREPO|nr:hypothetical protein DPMN_106608 [Dreissena polymorpha]
MGLVEKVVRDSVVLIVILDEETDEVVVKTEDVLVDDREDGNVLDEVTEEVSEIRK